MAGVRDVQAATIRVSGNSRKTNFMVAVPTIPLPTCPAVFNFRTGTCCLPRSAPMARRDLKNHVSPVRFWPSAQTKSLGQTRDTLQPTDLSSDLIKSRLEPCSLLAECCQLRDRSEAQHLAATGEAAVYLSRSGAKGVAESNLFLVSK
jgi:hypothetical protein